MSGNNKQPKEMSVEQQALLQSCMRGTNEGTSRNKNNIIIKTGDSTTLFSTGVAANRPGHYDAASFGKLSEDQVALLKRCSGTETISSATVKESSPANYDGYSSDQEAREREEHAEEEKLSFTRTLTLEKPYLAVTPTEDTVHVKGLVEPVGVIYSEYYDAWFVIDKHTSSVWMLCKLNGSTKLGPVAVMNHQDIICPTEIVMLNDKIGEMALLSLANANQASIVVFTCKSRALEVEERFVRNLTSRTKTFRGLALSECGSFITMSPFGKKSKLHVIQRSGKKGVKVVGGENPLRLAASGKTLVILFHEKREYRLYHLDASNIESMVLEELRVISNDGINVTLHRREIVNNQYFLGFSSAQIDANGDILIADEENDHVKLFKPTMGFIHRLSCTTPLRSVVSFYANKHDEVLFIHNDPRNPFTLATFHGVSTVIPHI